MLRSSHVFFLLSLLFSIVLIKGIFDRLKNANPVKQEKARLEVENAEDDLMQKTKVAIMLMKMVLEMFVGFICCMFCCC